MNRIVVSGANQGIGFHMAAQFLKDGCKVAVLDLSLDNVSSLKDQYGDSLLLFTCDISDEQAVAQCVNEVSLAFGGIDIAIQNACRYMYGSFENTSDEDFRNVFQVNFFGAVYLTRAVIPIMLKQSSGRIVFTGSSSSITGYLYNDAYAPSKGAVEALAKCLDIEYSRNGVSFHILHPPLTGTKSLEALPVPDNFKIDPRKVGAGLAKHIHSKNFVICHSLPQFLWIKICGLFPIELGKAASDLVIKNAGPELKNLVRK